MKSGYAPYIAHMGLACFDIERMIDFYSKVFDLRLTDRGVGISFPYKLAFMSADPSQHHQFALPGNGMDHSGSCASRSDRRLSRPWARSSSCSERAAVWLQRR